MGSLEEQLTALEERIAETEKSAKALAAAIRRVRAGAKSGRIADIDKGLPIVRQRAGEAVAAAEDLERAWRFDAPGYFASGAYLDELRSAAAAQDLQMFEKDGRIYAFPLIVRIEARDAAVRVGRSLERRVRPKALVALLAAMQKRPQRFREQQFLELLYRAYQHLAGSAWRKGDTGPGPVIVVADIHEMLTLLPGADYPLEEFGRDLLLLDRQPDLRTRDGARFEFAGSTLSRERVKRVTIYDENGRDHVYLGLRFVRTA